MGLFSSKKVITVGTQVQRVIKDDLLPHALRTAVLKHTLKGQGMLEDYIMEEVAGSIAFKGEAAYKYGRDHYTHGLPAAQMLTAAQSYNTVLGVLAGIEGVAVSALEIEYLHFAPANLLHLGWIELIADHGYNLVTNEITALSTIKGKPVYLQDIYRVIPTDWAPTVNPEIVETWGPSPQAGYTPRRMAWTGDGAKLVPFTPVQTNDALVNAEAVQIWYCWKDGTEIKEDHFDINFSAVEYPIESEYFQAKYTVGGVTKYWIYEHGKGTYPVLDSLFQADVSEAPPGTETFFPWLYFRYEKHSEITDTSSDAYLTSKKLAKLMGIDYDAVAAAIDDNPDIADIEQAMLMMAVPAVTENDNERRYLFDFFDRQFEEQENKFANRYWYVASDQLIDGTGDATVNSVVIRDARFKLALNNSGIFKSRIAGSIGAIGTHDSALEQNTETFGIFNPDTNTTETQSRERTEHIYRRQVGDALYDEIRVVNLRTLFNIFQDGKRAYNAIADDDDAILIIPVDGAITEHWSTNDKEELYSRSMHYVFNSKVVTKLHWYQTGFFQFLVVVVAIVMTVLSYGATAELAIGLANMGLYGAALMVVAGVVLEMVLISVAFKAVVKKIGLKNALIAAILAAVISQGAIMMSDSVAGAPWATDLLSISNNLVEAIKSNLQDMQEDLLKNVNEFSEFVKKQTQLLEDAQKMLEGNNRLDPMFIAGETPEEFFGRTIHSGNIGVLGIEAISSYVDVALRLPRLNDTVGGALYDV